MRLLPIVICLLLSVASSQQADSFLTFMDGFVSGIEKNANAPDACATDLHTYVGDAATVITDAKQVLGGNADAVTQLIADCVKLEKDYSSYNGACNFAALLNDISALNTSQGLLDVFWRVYDNADQLISYVKQTEDCTSNTTACGNAVGHIFSLLLNYSI